MSAVPPVLLPSALPMLKRFAFACSPFGLQSSNMSVKVYPYCKPATSSKPTANTIAALPTATVQTQFQAAALGAGSVAADPNRQALVQWASARLPTHTKKVQVHKCVLPCPALPC